MQVALLDAIVHDGNGELLRPLVVRSEPAVSAFDAQERSTHMKKWRLMVVFCAFHKDRGGRRSPHTPLQAVSIHQSLNKVYKAVGSCNGGL